MATAAVAAAAAAAADDDDEDSEGRREMLSRRCSLPSRLVAQRIAEAQAQK